tara:strand:- start:650 stop:1417 length:768 start_codon:yes stop_codon:yes gene_type:complete
MNTFNFGIILYPSTRSLAYLHILNKNKIIPKEVIVLGKWPFLSKNILDEANRHDYTNKYFSINDDLGWLTKYSDIDISSIDNMDINSQELQNILKKSTCKKFIFTGGGILREKILSLDIKFIHVHPGDIKHYRGSTCFYYSYLKDKTISCTTFIMKKELDKGEILDIKSIGQNIFIQNDQSIFVDYIYDPFIRSLALEKVLPFLIQDAEIKSTTIDNFYGEDHHVIHQSLRYLFIKRLNKTYQSNKKESIFIING